MNFEFSEQQLAIQDAVSRICQNFGEDYWLARDTDGNFPEEFVRAITEGGWLGIAMPEEFGGAEMSFVEQAIVLEELGRALLPSPYLSSLISACIFTGIINFPSSPRSTQRCKSFGRAIISLRTSNGST